MTVELSQHILEQVLSLGSCIGRLVGILNFCIWCVMQSEAWWCLHFTNWTLGTIRVNGPMALVGVLVSGLMTLVAVLVSGLFSSVSLHPRGQLCTVVDFMRLTRSHVLRTQCIESAVVVVIAVA